MIQMRHDIRTTYMFQKFAGYAGQGNWTIVASKRPVSRFEQGKMFAKDHSLGISPESIDC